MAIRILTPKSEYITDYPVAIEFAKQQAEIFWLPDEIEVEKDLHDLKTNCTEAEYHGVISTLKLFTLYELNVGNDYWQNYVSVVFPRPDIQRMAATFSYVEIGVHAPFYNKINEVLGLDNEEFYNSYKEDEVLSNRMAWIGKRTEKRDTVYDILKSVGIFSMIEGAILYSSFAFLKHFNSAGKNKLINVNAGINFSAIEETIHSQAGSRTACPRLETGKSSVMPWTKPVKIAWKYVMVMRKGYARPRSKPVNKRVTRMREDAPHE